MVSNYVECKQTRRYSPFTAVFLEKGKLNTPSAIQLFKMKNGGFDFYFKAAA